MHAMCATARRCWPSAPDVPRHSGADVNLSPSGDLVEAAANLFAALRTLDARRRHGHCRHADPGVWPGRSHQRPPAARRETPNERSAARLPALSPDLIERFRAIVGPSTRSPIPTSSFPTCASGATCTRAAPPSCCGPARPRRSPRSWRSPTSTAFPSCPRPATPASSAARCPSNGEIVLSVGRLKRVRAVDAARLHHDRRGRPDAGRGAGRRRQRQPPVPAQPAVGGHLPDRRQPRHQRRRRRRAGLRQRAPARARAGGGAGRRPHLERPQRASRRTTPATT